MRVCAGGVHPCSACDGGVLVFVYERDDFNRARRPALGRSFAGGSGADANGIAALYCSSWQAGISRDHYSLLDGVAGEVSQQLWEWDGGRRKSQSGGGMLWK